MAEKTTQRKPRPKQKFLPGAEPPRNKSIDDAAEAYFDVMQDRCALSKQEDEAKDNLIDKMVAAGLAYHVTPNGLVVTVVDKKNVRCKRKVESNGEAEE